jgi:hypothetical protein
MEAIGIESTESPMPLRYCSNCGTVMLLARVTPALLSLPELHTFRCPRCGQVMTWEIDVGSPPH